MVSTSSAHTHPTYPSNSLTEGADKDACDLRDMQIQERLRDHGEELLDSWKIGQFEKHTKVRHCTRFCTLTRAALHHYAGYWQQAAQEIWLEGRFWCWCICLRNQQAIGCRGATSPQQEGPWVSVELTIIAIFIVWLCLV